MTVLRHGMKRSNAPWAPYHRNPSWWKRRQYEHLWITCVRFVGELAFLHHNKLIYLHISEAHKIQKNVHKFFLHKKTGPCDRFFMHSRKAAFSVLQ